MFAGEFTIWTSISTVVAYSSPPWVTTASKSLICGPDGVARASLLRATGTTRDAQPEDLTSDHALPGVVPRCGDRVHLLADAKRLGDVIGIGRRGLGFQTKSALASPQLRCLVKCQPDRL